MGLRQNKLDDEAESPWLAGAQASTSDQVHYPVAPRYIDIPDATWQANNNWNNVLTKLPQKPPSMAETVALTPAQRDQILIERFARRAFDGAPPVIPHAINSRDNESCIVCHAIGSNWIIAGRRAPEISHPYMSSCTQCHVSGDRAGFARYAGPTGLKISSDFVGTLRPGAGSRAYPGAPPTVPHPVWMRQNCNSCHGPEQPHAISSPHPYRQNCLQCHAPNDLFDNRENHSMPLSPIPLSE